MTTGKSPHDVFLQLWDEVGLKADDLAGGVEITGADPVVPSNHRLGTAASAALAGQAAGVAAIWKLRTGEGQDVSVDLTRAVVPGLQTISHVRQNGHVLRTVPPGDRVNFFPTKDGRRFYILKTTNYPELLMRMMDVLNCGYDSDLMGAAIAKRDALELEDALAERGAVGVIVRDAEEWRKHPQGAWLASRPAVDVVKIGDSDPEPFKAGERPLSGVRVLDCTHVLAGPVTARVLAEQGAEVLHVSAPGRWDGHVMTLDTGLGKRSALLDFTDNEGARGVRDLVKGADIFTQSWRPTVMERHGLSPQALAEQRPGIIYVSISCYGSEGPWRGRGGFEPLGQAACGLVNTEGTPDKPRLAPTITMNDYLVPYLASTGVMAALIRRAREGGSYHVRVSLTRASMFVQDLGPLSAAERAAMPADVPTAPADAYQTMQSIYGVLRFPAPIARYSATKPYWATPPVPQGHDAPAWLA